MFHHFTLYDMNDKSAQPSKIIHLNTYGGILGICIIIEPIYNNKFLINYGVQSFGKEPLVRIGLSPGAGAWKERKLSDMIISGLQIERFLLTTFVRTRCSKRTLLLVHLT